jgi:hypothetical protein
MENSFDNGSFINELNPELHVARKNDYIFVLGIVTLLLIGIAGYCYHRMLKAEQSKSKVMV